MLDRTRVRVAERLGLFGDGKAFREILRGALVARPEIGKELNAELHWAMPVFRHPEVRAERASKDTAEALGPSPFVGPLRGHLRVTDYNFRPI